ncbi:hypothetical protein IT568_01580 [bacterium]|nr:hypothetical protein [bacterium]
MKICPKCKHRNLSERTECSKCGVELTNAEEKLLICKSCGTENSYSAKRCKKCNSDLQESGTEEKRKRKRKKHRNSGIPSEVRNIFTAILLAGFVVATVVILLKTTDIFSSKTKTKTVTSEQAKLEAEIKNDSTQVFITSNIDAEVFINGVSTTIYTNRKPLRLLPGSYKVEVKRKGYTVLPTYQELLLEPKKNEKMYFELKSIEQIVWRNTLKVTSNTKRAKIFLNNKDSGQFTDNVFTGIEAGIYTIGVEKQGFGKPQPKEIQIIGNDKEYILNFDLAKIFKSTILVKTIPVEGKIFINGSYKATGTYNEDLENISSLDVSFGEVAGYITPEPKTVFFLSNNQKEELVVEYKQKIKLKVEVLPSGETVNVGEIKLEKGFYDSVRQNFISETKAGSSTKIKKSEKHGFSYIELGYHSEGMGEAAIKITFDLPKNYELKRKPIIRLWGYATNSNFPFTFSNNSKMGLLINGQSLKWKYLPLYNLDENKILDYEEYDLARFLKQGTNEILIRTTDETTCYYAFQKLEITESEK